MKIRPVGAYLFHVNGRTDRQTDMTKVTVAFHSFANVSKTRRGGLLGDEIMKTLHSNEFKLFSAENNTT
jgi:hypothetical protein